MKKAVFISSRVHPGESPSSHVCQGMIDFLLGDEIEARVLRDNLIFIIVPMLNPDGKFVVKKFNLHTCRCFLRQL
jgi:murein tripeptide amidase MpaA